MSYLTSKTMLLFWSSIIVSYWLFYLGFLYVYFNVESLQKTRIYKSILTCCCEFYHSYHVCGCEGTPNVRKQYAPWLQLIWEKVRLTVSFCGNETGLFDILYAIIVIVLLEIVYRKKISPCSSVISVIRCIVIYA